MIEYVHKKTPAQKLEAKRESCRKSQAKNIEHIRAVWKAREEKARAELEAIKAKRPQKKPMTKEEQRQRKKELRDEEIKKEREFKKKEYVPPATSVMLKDTIKIGKNEVADAIGVPVSYVNSWILFHLKGDTENGWSLRGKPLDDLQEYFAKH